MTTAAEKMEALLNHLLDTSDTPGQTDVILQFNGSPNPAPGALRRNEAVSGVFDLLVMNQTSSNSRPFPLLISFPANDVARVMKIREDLAPKIVSPSSGGLIIPT